MREPQSSAIPTPRHSLTQWSFKTGKSTSILKYVQNEQTFKSQCIGSKKSRKSIDDLLTSQSIAGRRDFTDYDMLDAMVASALKKLLTHVHFRKRVSVEEQRAQKHDRFLRGRQTALHDL